MADILNLQQKRNAQNYAGRCIRCDGRQKVWDYKAGEFRPCPECTEPEPTRRAA
jgi:hypothetical protein